MEYIQLFIGILLIVIFFWLLIRNLHRKGFMNALLRIDTIGGIVARLYLVVTSMAALLG
jgi:type II secretory pathway component PulF